MVRLRRMRQRNGRSQKYRSLWRSWSTTPRTISKPPWRSSRFSTWPRIVPPMLRTSWTWPSPRSRLLSPSHPPGSGEAPQGIT
ncbi:hypothetical protein M3J09_009943 [Ascochyta lentis]